MTVNGAIPVERPYSPSCDENREPILGVLEPRLRDCADVLEIGSGTGQHAVHFARCLPHLRWHTSDRSESCPGILAWLRDAALPNVVAPLALDVLEDPWPTRSFDAVFSANTAHIMSPDAVVAMLDGVGRVLPQGGAFLIYGPFSYHGRHTAASNASFDQWLRLRDPAMGVRDIDWLTGVAHESGLGLDEDIEMPVNNRILVWRRL
jgi:SAM-dependent methyltransferase